MLAQIETIADKLSVAGIKPRDRIAILSENTIECAALIVSLWKIGSVAVPFSTRLPVDRLNDLLKQMSCKCIFLSQTYETTDVEIERLKIDCFVSSQLSWCNIKLDDLKLCLDADASIIFTSASTGSAKGVLHTIGNHYYSALGAHNNMPFIKGDVWVMSLPICHVSGFSLIMRSMIEGAGLYFPKEGEPLNVAIKNPALTHISLVSAQLSKLLQDKESIKRLKKFKAILIGGSAVPPKLIEEALSNHLPVFKTYGSTEAASQVTTTRPGDLRSDLNSSGRVLDYRQLKISDDGEILVKGKTLFKGYVTIDGFISAIDEKGFTHTGDTGELKDSNLFVTGRKDLMFISGGENIHPQEIERAIEQIKNVEQAIVVPMDDEVFGQIPAAIIKMSQPHILESQDIRNALEGKIEKFKIPKTILPWPDIEDTFMKPDRKAFQKYAAVTKE